LKRSGAAAIGDGVEGDVDLGIGLHHDVEADRAAESQTIRVDPVIDEEAAEAGDCACVFETGCPQQKPRAGDGAQHVCPQPDRARCQLGDVVERPKGHRPPLARVKIRQRILRLWRKAEDGVGQPHHAFRAEVVGLGRGDDRITDQPVDVGHPGRARVRVNRVKTQTPGIITLLPTPEPQTGASSLP